MELITDIKNISEDEKEEIEILFCFLTSVKLGENDIVPSSQQLMKNNYIIPSQVLEFVRNLIGGTFLVFA